MVHTDESAPAEAALPTPPGATGEHAPVSIDAFWKAHPDDRLDIIPPVPGVYVWTYNTMRLITSNDEKVIEERLLNLLKIVGRNQSQKVGPYALLTARDERKEISPDRSVVLHQLFAEGDAFGRWVAELAVHIQRPLYVGKAINLNKRITAHLRGQTNLKGYVEDRRHADGTREFECSMLDLVVTWYAAPVDLADGTNGQDTEVESDPETEGDDDIVDDLEPDPDAPQPHPDLERWLYSAESLLIRLAMPMFNEVQS